MKTSTFLVSCKAAACAAILAVASMAAGCGPTGSVDTIVKGEQETDLLQIQPDVVAFGETATSTDVQFTYSGASDLTYDTKINYLIGPLGWLMVSPAQGICVAGQPRAVTLTAVRGTLPAGGCSAEVVVTVGEFSKKFLVSMAVVAAAISTDTVTFGSDLTSAKIEIWSTSDSNLQYQVTDAPSWLKVDGATGTSKGPQDRRTVSLTVDRSGLPVGTYTSEVTIQTVTDQTSADQTAIYAAAAKTTTKKVGVTMTVPPTVSAGADQAVMLPANSLSLSGTVTRKGQAIDLSTWTTTWSEVTGPGTVTFSAANALTTTATFSQAGTYQLALTATSGTVTGSGTMMAYVVPSLTIQPSATSGDAPLTVDFTAMDGGSPAVNLPAGSTLNWDFGDLTPVAHGNQVSHTFTNSGSFVVALSLTLASGLGTMSCQQATIHVTTAVVQTGTLQVVLGPAAALTAGAQWNVDGGTWQNSAATASGLSVGSHTVNYKAIAGWTAPASEPVTITNGQTLAITRNYTQQTGSLQVTISPANAVTAGAQWSVDGGATWRASAATVSGLPVGTATVTYKAVAGWTAPANASASISNGQINTATGAYTQQAGNLQVTPATNLTSSGNAGGPFSPTSTIYTLTNNGGTNVSWTASKTQVWVTLDKTSGTLAAGATTTVTASFAAGANSLPPGSYSDTVTFTNSTDGTVNTTRSVGLTISAAITSKALAPGPSWDGTTSWSGRTVPAESAGLRGSGFAEKAIGVFDEPPYMWVTDDKEITVACDYGDESWIQEVEFWMEGNTVKVSSQSKSARTGTIGFSCIVQPPAATDGDVELYAYVRPVNGYERRIGPLPMTFNKGGSISRPIKTVKTSGGDYASVQVAVRSVASGTIIKVDPGTWICDDGSGLLNAVARLVTVQPADGYSLGDVILTRSARTLGSGEFRFLASKIHFTNIQFNLENCYYVYCPLAIYDRCILVDTNGATGPAHGYPWNQVCQVITSSSAYPTHKQYAVETTLTNYVTGGFQLERNCTKSAGGDSTFLCAGINTNVASLNTTADQPAQYYGRCSVDDTLTVLSATYSSATNRTTIALSGSPTLQDPIYPSGNEVQARILTGPLAGNHYTMVSQDDVGKSIVCAGDASSIAAGDTLWVSYSWHADAMQFAYGVSYTNVLFQRYRATGVNIQTMFWSFGPASIVDGIAVQLSIFRRSSGSINMSWWSPPQLYKHVVVRQVTHVGQDMYVNFNEANACVESFTVKDSIWETMYQASGTFPTTGMHIDNNYFERGTARGTSAHGGGGSAGASRLDANYRPLSGSPVLGLLAAPALLWDYYGNPIGTLPATLGAVQQ